MQDSKYFFKPAVRETYIFMCVRDFININIYFLSILFPLIILRTFWNSFHLNHYDSSQGKRSQLVAGEIPSTQT